MRDYEIRGALSAKLSSEHSNEPSTLIIEELGLCSGRVRIDLAVINGALNGFEIKSDQDTLQRLPMQEKIYSQVLDYITIVVSGNHHVNRVCGKIPQWWGIIEAISESSGVILSVLRSPCKNPMVDPLALAQLLWRDEALVTLERLGLSKGLASKPRRVLWEVLAANVPIDDLSFLVRAHLKSRPRWRAGTIPMPGDDSFPSCAMLSRSPVRLNS